MKDDDMYGWAQFQLLGSKPNRSRTISKFVLIVKFSQQLHDKVVGDFSLNVWLWSLINWGSHQTPQYKNTNHAR